MKTQQIKFWNLALIVAFFAGIALFSTSCKDDFTDEDALAKLLEDADSTDSTDQARDDSLSQAGDSVTVVIRILSYPSNTVASGATVTIYQSGTAQTATTNDDGIVSFKTLYGSGEVTMSAADHYTTRVSYFTGSDGGEVTSATFRLISTVGNGTFTVSGTAYAEIDITSATHYQAVPDGTTVSAYFDSTSAILDNIIYSDYPEGSSDSDFDVDQYSIELNEQAMVASTTTTGGAYTLSLPAIPWIDQPGDYVDFILKFGDFTADQKIGIENYKDGMDTTDQRSLDGITGAAGGTFTTGAAVLAAYNPIETISTTFTQDIDYFDNVDEDYTVIPEGLPSIIAVPTATATAGERVPVFTAFLHYDKDGPSNQAGEVDYLDLYDYTSGSDILEYDAGDVEFIIKDVVSGAETKVNYNQNMTGALSDDFINTDNDPVGGDIEPIFNANFKMGEQDEEDYVQINSYKDDTEEPDNSGGYGIRIPQEFEFIGNTPSEAEIAGSGVITVRPSGASKTITLNVNYGTGIKSKRVNGTSFDDD